MPLKCLLILPPKGCKSGIFYEAPEEGASEDGRAFTRKAGLGYRKDSLDEITDHSLTCNYQITSKASQFTDGLEYVTVVSHWVECLPSLHQLETDVMIAKDKRCQGLTSIEILYQLVLGHQLQLKVGSGRRKLLLQESLKGSTVTEAGCSNLVPAYTIGFISRFDNLCLTPHLLRLREVHWSGSSDMDRYLSSSRPSHYRSNPFNRCLSHAVSHVRGM